MTHGVLPAKRNSDTLEIDATSIVPHAATAHERTGDSDIAHSNAQLARSTMVMGDVHATIGRHMNEQQMIYVVVGDARTQRDRVADLGYGAPVQLDLHGQTLLAQAVKPVR